MDGGDSELGLGATLHNVVGEGEGLGLKVGVERANGKDKYENLDCDDEFDEKSEDLLPWVNDVRSSCLDSGGSGSGEVKVDVHLNLGLSSEPSSSMSAINATERENFDRYDHDTQNKRPKVHSFSLDWVTNFGTVINYLGPSHEEVDDEDLPDSRVAGDHAENKNDTLQMEDSGVRMDLTEDLLHMVFTFLDHMDLCRAASVCRQWRDASSHDDFWRYLNFENRYISVQQFEDMCQRYPNATAVNVYGTPTIHLLVMKALYSLRNLEVLTLGKGQLGETFFQALTDCHMLKSLTVDDTTLGNGNQEILIYHDELHDLQILKCRVIRISVRCPQLETLSLKRSSMPHAVLSCPILRELDIASCHKLSDAAILTAAMSCPLLESLDMSNCSCVSDETLQEIARACRNLCSLDASYCPNISLEDMCQRYPNATAVNVYGTPTIHLLVMKALYSLRNLEVLTLGKGQLGETFFQALTDCHMLKSLTVDDTTLGNGNQEILIYPDELHDLQILKCRVIRISVRCPQLETLSLKRSSMPHAVLSCPILRELDIASCHKLSDAAILTAAMSCPLLESLDMSNCSCVSDETLQEIARACRNLCSLDASYCPNISLESVRLQMLTVLKLHSCEGITSASIFAIASSYMLEVLELDNCGLLASVALELPRLKNIRLVHCRKFADLNLRSSMLSSITVSNCPSLQRISIISNALNKLVLRKQESLTTLALQCHNLQEVDLTECESLTNSICEVFSSGGGCPALRSLVLDSCESLTTVSFHSTSLVSLSLGGCRAITSLELKCPHLDHVSLDGCDHFERASFSPVGLRSLNMGICPKLSELHIEAPTMVSLELKGCGVLSEAFIYCPLLTSLDASFCSQLKDDCLSATTSSCPLIESLVLMSCPSVGPHGLLSLHCLPNLTYLDLSYTFLVSLQPVFDSCLCLKVLKLQACKYLSDSSLEPLYKGGALPSLCELDLSYGTLCQLAIEKLLAGCKKLTHVSLNGCVNMHDLDWEFNSDRLSETGTFNGSFGSSLEHNRLLQILNCVGCPNIKKVVIPPSARCFDLSSLNLSLSSTLKEIDISCCNLIFLNLSNCNSLEILKLDCPRLTSLFLQSCNIDEETVETAIMHCTILETLDARFCPKIFPLSMGTLRTACPSLKRIFTSLAPT